MLTKRFFSIDLRDFWISIDFLPRNQCKCWIQAYTRNCIGCAGNWQNILYFHRIFGLSDLLTSKYADLDKLNRQRQKLCPFVAWRFFLSHFFRKLSRNTHAVYIQDSWKIIKKIIKLGSVLLIGEFCWKNNYVTRIVAFHRTARISFHFIFFDL